MARQPDRDLFTLFGFVTWGDFGPFTIYTAQHGGHLVIFTKTWPDKPPSAAQVYDRARFKAAAAAWTKQPPSIKRAWEAATKRASLGITGYNLWIYHQLTDDLSAVRTIERHTGFALLP